MTHIGTCPVCNTDLKTPATRDTTNDRITYDCPNCGPYTLTGTAEASLNSYLPNEHSRAVLSHWLVHHPTDEPIGDDTIQEVVQTNHLPTPTENIENLLNWIHSQVTSLGDTAQIHYPALIARIGGTTEADVETALQHLTETGDITTALSGPKPKVRLTPQGWKTTAAQSAHEGLLYPHIFISHAATDNAIALRLDEEIKKRLPGTTTFIASRDEDMEDKEWFDTVRENLRDAHAYICIVTPISKDRHWVIWEHGAAWMATTEDPPKLLITTRAGIENAEIPQVFTQFQVRSLEEPSQTTAMLKSLGDASVRPSDVEAFCSDITDLVATTPPNEPWNTFEHAGRHYAWNTAQLDALPDRPGVPRPEGLENAVRDAGLTPEYTLEKDITRKLAQGWHQLFETDRKTWRKPLFLPAPGPAQVLVVQEPD